MVDAHYRGRLGAGLHLHAESHHEDFQEEQGMRLKDYLCMTGNKT